MPSRPSGPRWGAGPEDEGEPRQAARFQRILDRRGCKEKLPVLLPGEPDRANHGGRAVWYFAIADRPDDPPFKLSWEWDGTVWRLTSRSFPRE